MWLEYRKVHVEFSHTEKNDRIKQNFYRESLTSSSSDQKQSISVDNKTQTLDKMIEELHSLIGMDNLKNDIQQIINFLKVEKLREQMGIKATVISHHLVFTGTPGTGKTTVARMLGKIYKQLGLLTKGHLVEVDRASMVAGYVGQTAIKVDKVVKEALGSILFVDEAYTLVSEDDFGREAIETILKMMEDYRNEFIVIVAGYPEKMHTFLNANPGLKSRFNKFIHFPDYLSQELHEIFEHMCQNSNFILTPMAKEASLRLFSEHHRNNSKMDNSEMPGM